MEYDLVFDVAKSGYTDWPAGLFGLFFVAIGIGLVARRWRARTRTRGILSVFPYVFLGFAVIWTAAVFRLTYLRHVDLRDALREGRAEFVEGPVTHFVPMPYTGHARESFVVGGQRFEYSDYVITGGFNNTSSYGGPIREGVAVRIWHVGGVIARLEVRRAE